MGPPVKPRISLYLLVNAAFVLLVMVGAAATDIQNPRVLNLILLFALCSHPILDIDGLNGRYAPLGLFMLVYFVSFGLGDFTALFNGDASMLTSSQVRGGVFSKPECVILLGGIMLVLGYRVAVRILSTDRTLTRQREWPRSSILIVGVLFWAIGTLALYHWYVYIITDTTNEAVRKGLASVGPQIATAYMLAQMCQPLGMLLLAYAYQVFRSPFLLGVVIAIVAIQLLLGFIVDIKGLAMYGVMVVIVTSVLLDNRLPKGWLAVFAALVIFAFPLFQTYRMAVHGAGIARTTVIENFGKILEKTFAAEEKATSGKNRAQTFLERGSLKGSVETIVDKTGNGVDYQEGYTLSPILATFVPRIVWTEKHEVQTGQMVNKLFHISDSEDVFISPSHLGELYWNFGWPGALIGMGIIGAICGWVGARFNLADGVTVTRVLVSVLTMKLLITGFEGAVAPTYVTWMRSLAGVGILHLIFARVPVVSPWFQRTTSEPDAVTDLEPRGERLFPNLLT
jgi:hypothetical protein